MRGPLTTVAVAVLLVLTGCQGTPDITIATPPPGVDLSAVPEGGAIGTGLQFLDGQTAVSQVALAARTAEWFALEVRFDQRYTPTDEVPSIELHSYSGTATGSADSFNAELIIDGQPLQLFLRDGMLLAYADDDTLAALGFTEQDGFGCLPADQHVAESLLALVVPDRLIEALLANPTNPVATVHTGALADVDDIGEVLEFGIAGGSGVIGTMWVDTEAEPYPRRIVIADATGDFTAQFSAWNETGNLDEPNNSPSDC